MIRVSRAYIILLVFCSISTGFAMGLLTAVVLSAPAECFATYLIAEQCGSGAHIVFDLN